MIYKFTIEYIPTRLLTRPNLKQMKPPPNPNPTATPILHNQFRHTIEPRTRRSNKFLRGKQPASFAVSDTAGRIRLRVERFRAGRVRLRIERRGEGAGKEEEGEERDEIQFEIEHCGGGKSRSRLGL